MTKEIRRMYKRQNVETSRSGPFANNDRRIAIRIAVGLLLLVVLALPACEPPQSKTAIRAAQQYMRAMTVQPGSRNNLYRSVVWDAGDRVVGELDDDRFPDWARPYFVACVRWEETFYREIANPAAQTDPTAPARIRQTGRAQGWILMGEGSRSRILELTVDFDGHHFDWIDNWEAP
jgi:hypothetical protein